MEDPAWGVTSIGTKLLNCDVFEENNQFMPSQHLNQRLAVLHYKIVAIFLKGWDLSATEKSFNTKHNIDIARSLFRATFSDSDIFCKRLVQKDKGIPFRDFGWELEIFSYFSQKIYWDWKMLCRAAALKPNKAIFSSRTPMNCCVLQAMAKKC